MRAHDGEAAIVPPPPDAHEHVRASLAASTMVGVGLSERWSARSIAGTGVAADGTRRGWLLTLP